MPTTVLGILSMTFLAASASAGPITSGGGGPYDHGCGGGSAFSGSVRPTWLSIRLKLATRPRRWNAPNRALAERQCHAGAWLGVRNSMGMVDIIRDRR